MLQSDHFVLQNGIVLYDFIEPFVLEPHLRNLSLERRDLSLKLFYMLLGALANGTLGLSIVGTLSL